MGVPSIEKKSDEEWKIELFEKMCGQYIDIALEEQAKQIFKDVYAVHVERSPTIQSDCQHKVCIDDFGKLKKRWVKK